MYVWQYTYKAVITNTAPFDVIARGVTATNLYMGASLNFGDVPGGAIKSSTFTLNIDRRNPYPPISFNSTYWDISVTSWECLGKSLDTCYVYVFDTSSNSCVSQDLRTPITVAGVTRYVYDSSIPPASPTADLFYDDTCKIWNGGNNLHGTWTGDNEPTPNYCGPTAMLNLLSWYGNNSLSYAQLGPEANTNTWFTGSTMAKVCGEICLIDPVCWIACSQAIPNAAYGTLPIDMFTTLVQIRPDGYIARGVQQGAFPQEWFQEKLMAGTPVIIMGSESRYNLHWAVVTGIHNVSGQPIIQIANEINMPASTGVADNFYTFWSLDNFDSFCEFALGDTVGILPYTALWYEAYTGLNPGQSLRSANQCPPGVVCDYIKSPNGRFMLEFFKGVLYVRDIKKQSYIFQSPTGALTGCDNCIYNAVMQADGNFVVTSWNGQAIWSTGTDRNPGAFLALTDDGTLEVVGTDTYQTILWSTDLSVIGPGAWHFISH